MFLCVVPGSSPALAVFVLVLPPAQSATRAAGDAETLAHIKLSGNPEEGRSPRKTHCSAASWAKPSR